jgi:hypothetical protein
MRKFLISSTVALLGMATFVAVTVSISGSGANTVNADGATVIKEVDCQISPGHWSGNFILFTNDIHSVVTPSGNIVLKCHFDIPAGAEPAKAVNISGFPCGTGYGLTTDSKSVSTPGGKVRLTCQINGN